MTGSKFRLQELLVTWTWKYEREMIIMNTPIQKTWTCAHDMNLKQSKRSLLSISSSAPVMNMHIFINREKVRLSHSKVIGEQSISLLK